MSLAACIAKKNIPPEIEVYRQTEAVYLLWQMNMFAVKYDLIFPNPIIHKNGDEYGDDNR